MRRKYILQSAVSDPGWYRLCSFLVVCNFDLHLVVTGNLVLAFNDNGLPTLRDQRRITALTFVEKARSSEDKRKGLEKGRSHQRVGLFQSFLLLLRVFLIAFRLELHQASGTSRPTRSDLGGRRIRDCFSGALHDEVLLGKRKEEIDNAGEGPVK